MALQLPGDAALQFPADTALHLPADSVLRLPADTVLQSLKNKTTFSFLSLPSLFTIFAYAKTGGGSARPKTENVVFLFVSALAFH